VGTRRAGTHCSCGTMPDGCTLKSTAPSVAGAGTTALDVPAASGWPGASSAPLIVPPLKNRQRGTNRAPFGDLSRLFRTERRGSRRGGQLPHGRAYAAGSQAAGPTCPQTPTRLETSRGPVTRRHRKCGRFRGRGAAHGTLRPLYKGLGKSYGFSVRARFAQRIGHANEALSAIEEQKVVVNNDFPETDGTAPVAGHGDHRGR
jgi:hypothetical protein